MARAYDTIGESTVNVLSPNSAIDVGCGSGLLLLALKKRRVSRRGADYLKARLDICWRWGLEAMKFNL